MHELSLCRRILEIIDHKAREKNYRQVRKVYIEIGKLLAIEKAALTFSFEVITSGTVAQDAVLEILDVPGMAVCDDCHTNTFLNQYYDACSLCGSFSLTIIQGEELRVKCLEVE